MMTTTMMTNWFDRRSFEMTLSQVASVYEHTAPTVADWCDLLASAKDDSISLADVSLLARLCCEQPPANYAANLVYHRQSASGQTTTGHAGF